MRGSAYNSVSKTYLLTGLPLSAMTVFLGMMERSPPMRFGSKLEVTKEVSLSRWSFRSSTQRLQIHQLTPVFSAFFKAPDSVTNLKVIGDKFGEEIGDLEKLTWK